MILRQVILLFALVCASALQADERILDYRSEIRVQPDGALHITETLRVRAEGREIRRGIYRDFPTRYRDRNGNRVVVDFTPVSVRRNGGSEPWHATDRANGVRVYAGSADRLLEPGVHEYELVYLTNRQLGYFERHDELYFNAVPIQMIYDRWTTQYSALWASHAADIKFQAEAKKENR